MEDVYCSSQIIIPPMLPSILKKYAKAAIRTQPYDLLVWSAAYFRAMASGTNPPVKLRLEFPAPENRHLTLGYIKLLVYQFGKEGSVSRSELTEKWGDICLPAETLHSILRLGSFTFQVDWAKFVAITVAFTEKNLKGTMVRICEVFTEEPEGGSCTVPYDLFISLYRYLGEMDCGEFEVRKKSDDVSLEKMPCLPDREFSIEKAQVNDIESVTREVESTTSMETGQNIEGGVLNWAAVEPSQSDVESEVAPSIFSDSIMAVEVMTPFQEMTEDIAKTTGPAVVSQDEEDGEEEEEKSPPPDDETSDKEAKDEGQEEEDNQNLGESEKGGNTEEATLASPSLEEEVPVLEEQQDQDQVKYNGTGFEEETGSDMNVEEQGSVQTLMNKSEDDDERGSARDSEMSENIKPLKELGENDTQVPPQLSLTDVRPTTDRLLRTQTFDKALQNEEERMLAEEIAKAEEEERRRIEEEMREKTHIHVPGIGPKLPEDLMERVEQYLCCWAEKQGGLVMPRNLNHFLCPPLDLSQQRSDETEALAKLLEEMTEPEGRVEPSHPSAEDVVEMLKYDHGEYSSVPSNSSDSSVEKQLAEASTEFDDQLSPTEGITRSLSLPSLSQPKAHTELLL